MSYLVLEFAVEVEEGGQIARHVLSQALVDVDGHRAQPLRSFLSHLLNVNTAVRGGDDHRAVILPVGSGRVGSGQVRSGQVRSGQVRSGQVRSGQVRSGQVRSGRVGSGRVGSGRVGSDHLM